MNEIKNTVYIEDIADEFLMINDESEIKFLFDRTKGKFVYFTAEMSMAEEYETLEKFMEDVIIEREDALLA